MALYHCSLGHRPKSSSRTKRSAESAIHIAIDFQTQIQRSSKSHDDRSGLESESRFQRWRLWDLTNPGALPQARND
jgi:hypothetical protein